MGKKAALQKEYRKNRNINEKNVFLYDSYNKYN